MVIKVKDSSILTRRELDSLPALEAGGTNPAKENFCMEVCISDREEEQISYELEMSYFGDEIGEDSAEIKKKYKT